jgi:acyl carrier protein
VKTHNPAFQIPIKYFKYYIINNIILQPFLYNIKKVLTNHPFINIILYVTCRFSTNYLGGIFMTFDKIKEILAEQLDVDADTLTMDTDMARDLSADSLDVVEVLMSIEDEFGVEIPDEEIENIKTIGNLVEYIENNA